NIQPGAMLTAVISENIIGDLNDNTLGNAGPGIDIRASGDAHITSMTIGADPAGTFSGNIIAQNGTPGVGTSGDGIRIRRTDNALIDNFRIAGNVIQNNLNDGIDIDAENNGIPFGVEEILNFNITGNQILNNGNFNDGIPGIDATAGIAGRGIQLRADAGVVMEVDISENLIAGNRMSGIEARTFTDTNILGGPTGRSFQITGPRDDIESASGGDEGVIFGVWQLNEIRDNGFILNEDANGNAVLDPGEDLNGNGVLDVVREGHGIALGRIDFIDPDNDARLIEGFNNGGVMIPDQDGDGQPDLPTVDILDNLIANNAEDGIHIYLDKDSTPLFGVLADGVFSVSAEEVRTSRINILNNDIVRNGDDGLNIHNPFTALALIDFNDNLVAENGVYSELDFASQSHATAGAINPVNITGDGIEIITANFATLNFNANRNRIIDNNGRGVNILTAGNDIDPGTAYAILNFEDNAILSNTHEGFYLVNAPLEVEIQNRDLAAGAVNTGYTASTWLPDFDSNHELFNWGFLQPGAGDAPPDVFSPFLDVPALAPLDAPVTDLIFVSNIVDNNGGVVQDSGENVGGVPIAELPYSTLGGFVMRVGTATADINSLLNFPAPSVPTPREVGGVRARIEDNRFSGNFGRDFYLDGFVATVPPNISFPPDPLVRIDLQFENNRGGSIDVSGLNFNVFYTNVAPGTPDNKAAIPRRARDATKNLEPLGIGPATLVPSFGFSDPTLRIEMGGAAADSFGNFLGNNSFNVIYSSFEPHDPLNPDVGTWLHVPDGSLAPLQANPAQIPFIRVNDIDRVLRTEDDWIRELNAILQSIPGYEFEPFGPAAN
ncbi:MAG: hypothetical protein KDA80_10090, partial [Planctomycetaceae bacterium]|nr:hypothetical protein [Planctomycetaceae bacterium]